MQQPVNGRGLQNCGIKARYKPDGGAGVPGAEGPAGSYSGHLFGHFDVDRMPFKANSVITVLAPSPGAIRDGWNAMERFLGGSPLMIALRLAIISLVVGIIMSALGISPQNLVYRLRNFLQAIYDLGFDSIEWILQYLMLGALVVIPVWLITRLLSLGRTRKNDKN